MTNKSERRDLGWKITVGVLSVLLAAFITLFALSASENQQNKVTIDNIYTKNFYDLVDNVNNTENKLAKALNATSSKLQAKYLLETSNNTKLASISFNSLPYSNAGFEESLAFVNQLSGYTETLSKNLENGKSLSASERATLEKVYDSVLYMKDMLAEISPSMWAGYSIRDQAEKFEGDDNAFTKVLGKIKNVDVDYPTMIYDGPFSDSVINKTVKGLSEGVVSADTAKENLLKVFTSLDEASVEFQGEAVGRFETYNFSCKNADGKEVIYVQMTKQGGHLLTATSLSDGEGEGISMENAKEVALNFCARTGIESARVVWSDKIEENAYINIAPVESNFVLYPDLVKLKIDLANGDVLGYEATGYYTNHTSRQFTSPSVTKAEAKSYVPKKYVVKETRLSLIPLEYNREVECWEVAATLGGDEYYFYFNTQTGDEENILKVIKTNNGNLLM